MVDFDFEDGAVSGAAVVARRAVLWPLAKELGTTHPNPVTSARLVLAGWRAAVCRLAEAGLPSVADFKSRMMLSNCFPSLVRSTTRPLTLVCRNAACPWCRGRRAEHLASRCGADDPVRAEAIFGGQEPFVGSHLLNVPVAFGQAALAEHIAEQAEVCRALVRANRGLLSSCYWQLDVRPGLSPGSDPLWVVTARMFGARPKGKKLLPQPVNWEFWDLVDHSPEALSEAVSRVARYPSGLLTGDADLAAQALAARAGLRLSEFSGNFRGGDVGTVDAADAPG